MSSQVIPWRLLSSAVSLPSRSDLSAYSAFLAVASSALTVGASLPDFSAAAMAAVRYSLTLSWR